MWSARDQMETSGLISSAIDTAASWGEIVAFPPVAPAKHAISWRFLSPRESPGETICSCTLNPGAYILFEPAIHQGKRALYKS